MWNPDFKYLGNGKHSRAYEIGIMIMEQSKSINNIDSTKTSFCIRARIGLIWR